MSGLWVVPLKIELWLEDGDVLLAVQLVPFQVVKDSFLSLQVNGDRSSDLAFEAVTSVVASFRDPLFAFYLSHAETLNKYNYSGDPKYDPSKSGMFQNPDFFCVPIFNGRV